jgi:hypothetical protein
LPGTAATVPAASRRFLPASGPNLARRLVSAGRSGAFDFVGIFLVFELDKVGYIKKRVALQTEIDESRLHAGKHARDAAVVNGACEGVLVFAFVVNFRELIVLKNCKPRLMRRAGNAYFLCHRTFPSGSGWLPVPAARSDGVA